MTEICAVIVTKLDITKGASFWFKFTFYLPRSIFIAELLRLGWKKFCPSDFRVRPIGAL